MIKQLLHVGTEDGVQGAALRAYVRGTLYK